MVEREAGGRRLHTTRREGDRVTPLELFFDLVFVLCITQCTALMAEDPTWTGIARGLLVLSILWWAWSGYAWLTSAVDPEEGPVRFVIFAAMAAFLVVALCVPQAFGDLGLEFALGYAAVRGAHLVLFVLASRDDAELRRSVVMLAASSALAIALLTAASTVDGDARLGVWCVALLFDVGGPFLFGAGGWRLMPKHFAERFNLIFLIALGESIVAIGVGAQAELDGGVVVAAVLGTAIAAAMWWIYFDVVALVAERRLSEATAGEEQNRLARDAYALLHLPMVAGVVGVALGLKHTLAHVHEHLTPEIAAALVGGVALYLLAHIGFRLRNLGTLNSQRLITAVALLGCAPLATRVDAIVAAGGVATALWALVGYEAVRFADARHAIRSEAGPT